MKPTVYLLRDDKHEIIGIYSNLGTVERAFLPKKVAITKEPDIDSIFNVETDDGEEYVAQEYNLN